MNRSEQLQALETDTIWDIIVIGGGATGLGTALDASLRGYKTLVLEGHDFAKGTSSRSTKLVHGGVRYLEQGNIKLVREALRERGYLLNNAPHLTSIQTFIVPVFSWWEKMFYGLGLKFYDLLSGKLSLGDTQILSKKETVAHLPTINAKKLAGGILYYDGQFNDSGLAIELAATAIKKGATVINYCRATGFTKTNEKITAVECLDVLSEKKYTIKAKAIVNATGVFTNAVVQMDEPLQDDLVSPSQGIHLVIDANFFPGIDAMMIPKTDDGRVLFAVPWHNHLLVGTTDTPLNEHSLEPRALKEETDFILATASAYFNRKPTENDILSVFSGLRPLAAPTESNGNSTKEISRDHKLIVSAKGLITITGGKWTTYRKMAEETIDLAIKHSGLAFQPCITKDLKIHGCADNNDENYMNIYGTDKILIEELCKLQPGLNKKLHPNFPHTEAEVVWTIKNEMAETVEDVLSRRLRILFIDATAAIEMCPRVASLLATELGADKAWEENQIKIFNTLASGYVYHQNKKEREPLLVS